MGDRPSLRPPPRLSRRSFIAIAGMLLAAGVRAGNTCPACGAPLEDGARFCTACGHKVASSDGSAGAAPPAATPPAVAPDAAASVVQVMAAHDRELTSAFGAIVYGATLRIDTLFGSAFAFGPGSLMTDAAIVAGARTITLRAPGGREATARLAGIDPLLGVAFLEADIVPGPPLPLRLTPPVRPGEGLTAIGYAAGGRGPLIPARTTGVVSGVHRTGAGLRPFEDYIQSDAALPDGFAGGPLVDAEGRVIGMATGLPIGRRIIMDAAPGIGLSLAAPWLERARAWLIAGRPARPWLGFHHVEADKDLRARHGLDPEIRTVIDLVFEASPAAKGGLRRGDGLVSVDGIEARSLLKIQEHLIEAAPGATWPVVIARRQERLTLPVTLAERPERPRLAAVETLLLYGGLEIVPKPDGALAVGRVRAGSPAADAKIAAGDVLQAVLVKKDLANTDSHNARWRDAGDLASLERNLAYAWSEFDFFVVLKLRARDGDKRYLPVLEMTTPGNAL